MKSDSSMGFWSFVLSALILAPGLGVGISRATGFANTASAASAAAQAQAASAPQPTASRPAATVALALAAKSDDEEVETYEVKRGDTLTKVFGKHAGAVCKFNHLRNCNQIEPKQVLKLPEGVTPREVRVVKSEVAESLKSAKAKVTKRPMRAAKPVQEESCLKLGTAPFNRYGDMKLRLQGIDLSPVLSDAEKAEAKALVLAGRGERMLVTSDMVFEAMPFRSKDGQVKFVKNAKVCTPEQGGRPEVLEVWKLSTGKLVADPTSCGNIGPVLMTPRPEPPLVMETPPETVVNPPTIEVPAPVLTPEPPAPQLAPNPPVAAAPRGMCDFVDVAGALGQHHVPRQNGDKASSDVLTLVLDCQQRKEDETGSWGIGFKLNYAAFDGTTHRGAGRYDGRNHLAQLSYREINDDGTDWGVGVGVGKQREEYRQAALAQQARYNLVGATWVYNDSRRLLAGETFDVKRQYYAGITIPTSSSFTRTIFNQSVDASNMPRLKVGLQAGARWYVWQPEDSPIAFFVEGGLFWQHPISASANILGGIADKNHICGIGPGLDKDLMHGGKTVGAWGWNCDPFQGGRVARREYRKHQFISDLERAGGSMDQNGMIRLPKNLK